MTTPKVWLVTGASSGLGRSMTMFALSKGDIVVATLRKPEALNDIAATYSKDRLLILKLDVTKQADIDQAFEETKQVFGRLDVVFNNAGQVLIGEAETTPIDNARALFEVDFWGAVNVSLAAIRFFRDVNEPGRGGVLLQNSSVVGFVGTAGFVFYGAGKQALDAFSEGLMKELLPQWNIKICVIQTGTFETNCLSNAVLLPENPTYRGEGSNITYLRDNMAGFKPEGDPNKFAKAIHTLVEGGNIPMYLPIGADALVMAKGKLELLNKAILEAEPWSADLARA